MVRRKEIPCVLCGEATYDQDKVCDTCRTNARAGRSLRQQIEEGELQTANVAWYWQLYPHYGHAGDSVNRIKKAALALAGARKVELKTYYFMPDWEKVIGLLGKPMSPDPGVDCYLMSPEKQAALRELIQAICDLLARYKNEGYSEGASFLRKLVNDEVSFSDLVSRNLKSSR